MWTAAVAVLSAGVGSCSTATVARSRVDPAPTAVAVMWTLNDWPGASVRAVHVTWCDPAEVVTRQRPSVEVADTIESWPAASVSVTVAGRITALPSLCTTIVNVICCPNVTVVGVTDLDTLAPGIGSTGAVTQFGSDAVAVAMRT